MILALYYGAMLVPFYLSSDYGRYACDHWYRSITDYELISLVWLLEGNEELLV